MKKSVAATLCRCDAGCVSLTHINTARVAHAHVHAPRPWPPHTPRGCPTFPLTLDSREGTTK